MILGRYSSYLDSYDGIPVLSWCLDRLRIFYPKVLEELYFISSSGPFVRPWWWCRKLPRGGNSEKASTHMGLEGINSTIAASPDLMDLGLVSVAFPVRRSTFSLISLNLQAI